MTRPVKHQVTHFFVFLFRLRRRRRRCRRREITQCGWGNDAGIGELTLLLSHKLSPFRN